MEPVGGVEVHDLPGGCIYRGHVLDTLRGLPDESCQVVVTSPPYW